MIFWKKHKPKRAVEELDTTPLSIPIHAHRPPSLQDQMRKYVRNHLNNHAVQNGMETFEEANDFDVGDPDPASPHELEFGDAQEARFEEFVASQTREWKKHQSLKASASKKPETGKTDPEGSVSGSKTDSK